MDYLQNHCWCSSSCWTGEHYRCRHLVSISFYEEDADDWDSIIDDEADTYIDSRRIKAVLKQGYTPSSFDLMEMTAPNLRPHVLQWLDENVKDRVEDDCEKGWAVGDAAYRGANGLELTVFFHRKNDAMKFIKTFSKYKKPVNYCQYFKDDRKQLNLETMKYEKV